MKYDIIIIGGGLGGLVCGCILSRAGKRLLVLEKGKHTGGCIQSYRRGGMEFDTGFHYVGGLEEGQLLRRVFDYLGLMKLPWKRMDEVVDRVMIGKRTFALAQGYDRFAQMLADEFPAKRDALYQYADLLKRTEEMQLNALNPHSSDMDFHTWMLETNAYRYLQEKFDDSLLVDVLSGASLKMELRKDTLPLFTFTHGYCGYVGSSWRIAGSGSLIAEALAEQIRSQGGEVICNAEVDELLEKEGQLTGVRCKDGRIYEGIQFICATHPAEMCRMLKQGGLLKNVYRHRICRQENTNGMFTVSLCLKPHALPYANWNYYVYRHPDIWTYPSDGEIDRVLAASHVPDDGGEYVRQIDLLAPMDWSLCRPWIFTQVGKRGPEYEAMKLRMADACMTLAESCIPGLRRAVVQCYTSTPLTYRDYVHTPDGSAYGMRKDFNSPFGGMLPVRTPIPDLFLTGQSLMVHGVQGVTMTALFTCAEIIGRDWIWKQVIQK